jgi:hypothetical protein
VVATLTSRRQAGRCLEEFVVLVEKIVQHVRRSYGEGRSGGWRGHYLPEHMATMADKHQCLAAKVPQHRLDRFRPLHGQHHVEGVEAETVAADDEVFTSVVNVKRGALARAHETIPIGNRHA